MGKRSVKANKTIYQLSREEAGLTREEASEIMEYISDDRIERIENERSEIRPDEVVTMSECYKNPSLCNYYCTHECPIGRENVDVVEKKNLTQITLEILSDLNTLEREKNRFIEISADSTISTDEQRDFEEIKERLESIARSVDSLRLWIKDMELSGIK
ncbi:MAG: helix-turn-helix transcriptional regulator [Lachnospiraceae bacterium]|nr:helix-turn-helix transcriptional regulator [Lachnospiraceae bacterium]